MNETKKNIIKAALKLFLQKSYKEVTMEELLRITGLSKGAFYHHFQSKEQLFKVIVSLFYNLGTIDYSAFPIDSLKGFYQQYVASVTESLQQMFAYIGSDGQGESSYNFFLILFDAQRLFPEFKEVEQQQYEEDRKAWEYVIRRAKRKKEIRTKVPDEQIAQLFLFLTDGVFLRFVSDNSNPDYASVLMEAFDSLYSGLR
ncbi:MAG: TetR/AcrR family transcriptional regulator [Bacteroidales bacterium]|nr:TetR/AcrR family transcriptional regulator [Bacteroidales bacterium]